MNTFLTLLISSLLVYTIGVQLEGPVDLSWPYDETASSCPGGQNFTFLKQRAGPTDEGVWLALNTFAVAEHCGTHIDAPYHFDPEGPTLEKLPIEKFLTTGVYIDASAETGDNVNYTMPLSKVKDWEKIHGPLPNNSVVLVKFGWVSRYKDKKAYLGLDNGFQHPGLEHEVAQYLIETNKVVGVGVDCSSVDAGYDKQYHLHRSLTKAGVYILENVAITVPLPPLFKLIVAPIKIANGTGGPVRLFALPLDYTF